MALTNIYVNPAIAANSGTGTIGDPFGDLEYAIRQTTFDATNGTRVNIKAGTDEVLVANLETSLADTSVSIAWVPVLGAQLVFQGYSAVAGDLADQSVTRAGISGGGSVAIINTARNYIHFLDLHLHNCGTATILSTQDFSVVLNCEIDNTTGSGIDCRLYGYFCRNYVHNCGTVGIDINAGAAAFNYLENGVNKFTYAIWVNSTSTCVNNIISVDSNGTTGMNIANGCYVANNSIYSNGGGAVSGVLFAANTLGSVFINNLVEGWSGASGKGITLGGAGLSMGIYANNSVYNCETAYSGTPAEFTLLDQGNTTLSASPFTSAATGDFSPVDTGTVKEGSWPSSFFST